MTQAVLRRLGSGGWFLESTTCPNFPCSECMLQGSSWVRGPWYSATALGRWANDNDVQVIPDPNTEATTQ